jgi:hypothetical protein
MESSQVDAINYGIPSWAVDLACRGNIALAQSMPIGRFPSRKGNPYPQFMPRPFVCSSHIVAGRFTSAIEELSTPPLRSIAKGRPGKRVAHLG